MAGIRMNEIFQLEARLTYLQRKFNNVLQC